MMKEKIAAHSDCTGCMACLSVCPVRAISVTKDSCGFVYPIINETACINCGRCTHACPILNITELNWTLPQKSYAAKITNDKLVEGCTSGGITTAFAEKTIKKGGAVYGASYVPHIGTKHIRISSNKELELLKGSKYVESYTADIYEILKHDAKAGIEVLFVGTPCQIAAVERLYTPSKYPNLHKISFVCGGVPSHDFLESHLRSHGIDSSKVDKVVFRKGRSYCIEAHVDGKVAFYQPQKDNLYLYAFDIEGYPVRPSCLRCKFCQKKRVGDMTVGDFWGIEATQCQIKNEKDLSCVMIHNKWAEIELKSLNSLLFEEAIYEDISRPNVCLRGHRARGSWKLKEYILRFLYPIIGFDHSVRIIKVIAKFLRAPQTTKKIICGYINKR